MSLQSLFWDISLSMIILIFHHSHSEVLMKLTVLLSVIFPILSYVSYLLLIMSSQWCTAYDGVSIMSSTKCSCTY